VKVTNLNNGRDVIVRVNNRGPYLHNRIIDLSKEAAKQLGMVSSGIAKVKVEVLSVVEPIEQFGQNAWRKVANR
jgi:rare lipoprotein A